jgi:RNA polymerase sigma-70 factor, ECF subfamily
MGALEVDLTLAPFAGLQELFGFIPNLFRAQTLLPRVIEAEAGIARSLLFEERALSRKQKLFILLGVAAAYRNAYCVTAYRRMLHSSGVAEHQLDQIIIGSRQADLSVSDTALIDFALKLATNAPWLSGRDIAALRGHAFVDEAILEAIGNAEQAQDAMQDTFLKAFEHIGDFKGRSKFSTWLVSIASNTALQLLRERKHLECLDDAGEEAEFRPRQVRAWDADPEQLYSQAERRRLVESGLMKVPSKYRAVLVLRDLEQLSAEEAATALGLRIPAVKARLFRARMMLREALSPHFAMSAQGLAGD